MTTSTRCLVPILLLVGAVGCTKDADSDTETGTDTGLVEDTGEPWRHECTTPAPLPVASTLLPGFTNAEDFAFDGEGYLVSIDEQGNLVGIDQEGHHKVILPDAGQFTSGMHMLLDGSFVYSDAWAGTLMRAWPSGASAAVLSGMMYPNGIEVDRDGMVYVTEHDAGRVRRVDPETGESTVIATGIHNPNGVQFSTDYQTLYVGSFGGGMVHLVEREEAMSWSRPRLLGIVPTIDQEAIPDPCAGLTEGDECIQRFGGLGECTELGGGETDCPTVLDVDACSGLTPGEVCTTDFLGTPVASACVLDSVVSAEPFCPRTASERLGACKDASHWDGCMVRGESGYCVPSWEGVLICALDADYTLQEEACDEVPLGDPCTVPAPTGPYQGTCQDYTSWGYGIVCEPWYGWGDVGGLDGIGVDACDNIYVTEYVTGVIYRFSPAGDVVEVVDETGAFWIPNMHWGNGIGGWDEEVLYVLDREAAVVHALEVGVLGSREAYQPEAREER